LRAILGNWPVLIPLILFGIAATIIPTMTNIATTDDWAYARSVEILYWDVKLTIFPVVAATAVGQVFWGGLFALIFGMELGVMRLSTVVIVALGAVALYAILRQLGVSRSRSSLGMALYLFNPLAFILAFSFMTDPHFASVMLFSIAFYVFGLHPGRQRPWAIVLGSLFAGYAFWIRQQGALIPLSVVVYLFVSRQLWFDRRSVRRTLQVALAPAIMLLAYYAWLYWVNDVPDVQEGFLDRARGYGWDGVWHQVRYLTYFELAYLGFFLIPLTVAMLPGFRARLPQPLFSSPFGYWAFLGWVGALITGLFLLTKQGRQMPYIGQFLGAGGFGPGDVPGPRRRLIEWLPFYEIMTIVSVASAVVLGLLLCRRMIDVRSPERAAAGLLAMVCLWQVIGILPPSFQYLTRGGSLDRYLLPIIPLVIALVLWASRDLRMIQPVAWAAIAVFAVVSTAGTRDYLVYMDAVWSMAARANEAGVPNEKMDAGASWDGYHLYTDMIDQGVTRNMSPSRSPWWINFYAKQTDSTYIVSTSPTWREGYVVVDQREYDQWLEEDPVYVYLLRQRAAPWPPPAP
jgi:4-amino-4-deoxy-L-arabinose transferase-like glycosyltransferase